MAELGLGLSHTGHTFEAPNRRRCTLELGGNEDGGGGGDGALKGARKNTSGIGGGEGEAVTRITSLPLASADFFFLFFFFLFSVSGQGDFEGIEATEQKQSKLKNK